jgi:nucleotide-binding universal stress UspA family protein
VNTKNIKLNKALVDLLQADQASARRAPSACLSMLRIYHLGAQSLTGNLCTAGCIKKDGWSLKSGELLSKGFQFECYGKAPVEGKLNLRLISYILKLYTTERMKMFAKMLLAVDGSDHALHAAKMAGDLARNIQSESLRIVVAFSHIPSYLGEPNMQAAIDARFKESDEILKTALEVVGEIPGEIHTEMIEGSPAEAIINVAVTRNSDLIVMGSRGMSSFEGLLLGSNSQKVVSHAPCPVLIVR